MRKENQSFYQGVALVVADLIRSFDQPVLAKNLLDGSGIGLEVLQAANVDEYDLNVIRELFESRDK